MKLLILVTISTVAALAQPVGGTVRFSTGGQAREAGTVEFVSAVNVGPTIAGAPFSADVVNETVQTLADGNRIVDKQTTKQYRDSQGRERRELGPMIVISDPVAKLRYTLHTETKTADKVPMDSGNFYFVENVLAVQRFEHTTFSNAMTTVRVNLQEKGEAEPVTTLSVKTVEGLQANGTRTVHTIPAGSIGNERPIEVVDETYTSPELGITILTTHSDPRTGVNTYRLTNIQRADPPRSLFEIPSDYQVNELGRSRLEIRRKEE